MNSMTRRSSDSSDFPTSWQKCKIASKLAGAGAEEEEGGGGGGGSVRVETPPSLTPGPRPPASASRASNEQGGRVKRNLKSHTHFQHRHHHRRRHRRQEDGEEWDTLWWVAATSHQTTGLQIYQILCKSEPLFIFDLISSLMASLPPTASWRLLPFSLSSFHS